MNFAWPLVLWLLAVPVVLLAWSAARRRATESSAHPKILRADAGPHSVDVSRPGPRLIAGAGPLGWLAVGLVFGVIALARPQWGRLDEPIVERSREVLVAIDLSRSMLSEDIKPSRLERARLLTQALLDRLAGERVGLEVFAGTAFIQAPLSADYDILREILPTLGPESMPVGGTNYSAMIDAASSAFSKDTPGTTADRFLVVLSDGGATDDEWQAHVDKLREAGIRVVALGIGTEAGALIPDGTGEYMKDENGAVVLSRLEAATLRQIADQTGGAYRDASDWLDLAGLLKSTVGAGRQSSFIEQRRIHYIERFQWALAPALVCLFMSFWLEMPIRPKPREIRLGATSATLEKAAEPALAGLASAAAIALLLAPLASHAISLGDQPPEDPSGPLSRIVGRLSTQDRCSSRDWSEMAQETIDWGQRIQSSGQAVPDGPVADALAAVDAGTALDPSVANWGQLRSELQALRVRPPERKPPPKPPQKQPQSGGGTSGNPPQNTGSAPRPITPQSDLGRMQPPSDQPPTETQQIGGAAQRPPNQRDVDPALAVPLQNLDEARNEDSPGRLFQLLENNAPRQTAKGKDW